MFRGQTKRAGRLALWIGGLAAALYAAYNEQYRPQFHFSPKVNWTNDPCGLVYAFGKYHLFFQHNPFGILWGHMSWGHSASADLVHWSELPVAIPDDKKAATFTGSSVFDTRNSSGLCRDTERGCIVSIYTGYTPKTASAPERQTQNLAYSGDGLTWTKYSGNPVLDLGRSDTRDPKVFWYEPAKEWVMLIVQAGDKKVRLFKSQNLKDWGALSEFGPAGATGGVWECPDLYRIPIEGQPDKSKWILKIGINPGHIAGGSGEQYFTGTFDGKTFLPDEPNGKIRWLDYGRDCYCALTFNNAPEGQNPRMIGWMSNWQYAANVPTSPWRGQMTLPRVLKLTNAGDFVQLLQEPVPELQSLRTQEFTYSGKGVGEFNRQITAWPNLSQTFEIDASVALGDAKHITLSVLKGVSDETSIGFDAEKGELFVDRSKSGSTGFSKAFPSRTVAPLAIGSNALKLQVFVDQSSVEVFAQDGAIVMTNLVYPHGDSKGISLSADGKGPDAIEFRMWRLSSIWKNASR